MRNFVACDRHNKHVCVIPNPWNKTQHKGEIIKKNSYEGPLRIMLLFTYKGHMNTFNKLSQPLKIRPLRVMQNSKILPKLIESPNLYFRYFLVTDDNCCTGINDFFFSAYSRKLE